MTHEPKSLLPTPKLIRGGLFYFACGQSSMKYNVVLVQQMIQ